MIRHLQRWARKYRERGKYTPVGGAFHWIMAAAVTYQLYSGWDMQRHLVGGQKLDAYQLHSEIGLTLLLLGVLRLGWRLAVPIPINDRDEEGWRATVAHATHAAFYVLFAVLPISGWMMWSAIQPARPLYVAGLLPVPAMPFHHLSPEWQFWMLEKTLAVHVISVVVLTVLIVMHVGAALKHHFWDRDDVLEGMLPDVPHTSSHPGGKHYNPPEA